MNTPPFRPGDWIIYRKQKVSASPGPRAQQTMPASKGETYNYVVEKYWVVRDVTQDGQICLQTRRGKLHQVPTDDPRLRKANWWERLLLRQRFQAVENCDYSTGGRKKESPQRSNGSQPEHSVAGSSSGREG